MCWKNFPGVAGQTPPPSFVFDLFRRSIHLDSWIKSERRFNLGSPFRVVYMTPKPATWGFWGQDFWEQNSALPKSVTHHQVQTDLLGHLSGPLQASSAARGERGSTWHSEKRRSIMRIYGRCHPQKTVERHGSGGRWVVYWLGCSGLCWCYTCVRSSRCLREWFWDDFHHIVSLSERSWKR